MDEGDDLIAVVGRWGWRARVGPLRGQRFGQQRRASEGIGAVAIVQPVEDEQPPVWVVPNPNQIDSLLEKSSRETVSR